MRGLVRAAAPYKVANLLSIAVTFQGCLAEHAPTINGLIILVSAPYKMNCGMYMGRYISLVFLLENRVYNQEVLWIIQST